MMNFNATCILEKSLGTNVYGAKTLDVAITQRCAVIRTRSEMVASPPRSQMSATRGYAWEFLKHYELMLPSDTTAAINDKITIFGAELRIIALAPALDAFTGKIDHYIVSGDQWD